MAKRIRIDIRALLFEKIADSMIRSFEKNPAKKGNPRSDRLAIDMAVMVMGS